jgi:hypothetical protein
MKAGKINTGDRTSMVIKWFTFLLHIWKVPVSDLAQTGYPH